MGAQQRLYAVVALSVAIHGLVLAMSFGLPPGRTPATGPETLHVQLLSISPSAASRDWHVPKPVARSQAKLPAVSAASPGIAVSTPAAAEPADLRAGRDDDPRPAEAYARATAAGGADSGAAQVFQPPASTDDLPQPLVGLAYRDNLKPEYPLAARRRGVEGRVVVRAKVGADGQVLDVGLEQTSGNDLLDRAALSAIKDWRFVPARRGTNSVEAYALVPVSFRLGG